MEDYLKDFNVPAKHPSEAALKKWRKAVSLVKNHRRRFRHVADLEKRSIHQNRLSKIKEDLRVTFIAMRAAMRFMDAAAHPQNPREHHQPREIKLSEYTKNPDKLASMVRNYDMKTLRSLNGATGIAEAINVSIPEGVKSTDIPTRQETYGVNKYTEKPSKSFFMFIWDALHDLTLIILIVCAIVSIAVGLATEGFPNGIYDGLGILLSILLVVTVTAVSDYKQSLQFKDLDKEKKKISCHVTRDSGRKKVSIYDLVVGDVVHLSIGDQVPADGIFISGYNLLIDESSLTGESDPVNINEKKPFLLAGTKVQDGSAKMLVTAVGMKTEWGKLMETLSEEGEDETPLQVKLNGVATIIGKIGLIFAVLTFLVLTVRFLVEKAMRNEFTTWTSTDALSMLDYFATAVTIIVVAVPEGLPLAVTLSLAFAMKQLMKDKALVRHLSACETMGSATVICTDKTGTLTTNHMLVTKIFVSGEIKSVTDNQKLPETLLQGVFECTGSEVVKDKSGNTSILGTPTESAILQYGLDLGGDFETVRGQIKMIKMEPFNSAKKKMSVVVTLPEGKTRAFCKGASEIVLGLCDKMIDGNGEVVELSEEKVKLITNVIEEFAVEALRTLCLAYLDIEGTFDCDENIPESGYTLIAVVGIKDPLRPGVKEAVETCLAAGITVRMVTGDNINTAKAIAKECGILTEGGIAIEGPDFRTKTKEELNEIAPRIQVMARSSPTDKHELVKHLKGMSEVVAVTGDGTNDAPALHESDIGFAMGIAGTEVAKEQADVIVMDDDFATIVKVAKWGRAVYINIQKFVQFQLTVNIVALMINFVSACITGSAPLTAVQLLWVNLIMDTLGALALATEPPNDGLMKRPPVKGTESFITKTMWRNIIGQSVYQMAILFVLNFAGKSILNLHGPNSTAVLNTFIFNTFVFCQVFNEINSRDIEKINIFRGMFSSWVFMGVMISTVVFQVIIVEFLGTFASTVPLDWELWGLSIVIGLVFNEINSRDIEKINIFRGMFSSWVFMGVMISTVVFQVIIVEFLGTFASTVPLDWELWGLSIVIGLVSMPIAVLLKCILVEKKTRVKQQHDGYEVLPDGLERVLVEMEAYLTEFDLPAKHWSESALGIWRNAVSVVKNRHRHDGLYKFEEWHTTTSLGVTHRRRFRPIPIPVPETQSTKPILRHRLMELEENLRIVSLVKNAAFTFLHGASPPKMFHEHHQPRDVNVSEFRKNPDKLASMVHSHDLKTLRSMRGVDGIAEVVNVSTDEGVNSSDISTRQETYGINKYIEKPSKSFLMFVWEALHDLTLIILIVCAMVLISIGLTLTTKGRPYGRIFDGLAILLAILCVVIVSAVSDYKLSLLFKEHDKKIKKNSVHVTRDGCIKKVLIYDLVVGDIVHLSTGDQVPADGIFISGYNLLIIESSLIGKSDPVNINEKKPFLLAGTMVQDGSAKMIVTAVGMKTKWRKLMETLSQKGEDETPLQVKLDDVATIIGKIGLVFAVLTFLVLTVRFLVEKAMRNEFTSWTSTDASSMLDYFATAITIIVVAVPEGLPLAVTLSLAFAMKQLMKDKALVRHLSACETMGSATVICTAKTGTLTTNHMVVTKIFVSGEIKSVKNKEKLPETLLQGIFECTRSEVVKDKSGKTSILGTATESAILQYGLDLGGDFETVRGQIKMLKMEPFNSAKNKMSVVVTLPEGKTRAFCKGAPEIVLGLCDKMIDGNGEVVELSEEKVKLITNVIEEFAVEALRTLCLAYLDIEGSFNCEKNIPESGYILIAVVGIKDPLRPGVKEAVETCLAAGITVRMVTGDNINTAKAIAKECGILTEGGIAIEGPDFQTKTKEELNEIAPRIQVMARSSPTDKHELVKHLKGMSEAVAVIGDGTNDAPTLHESDIGFAMGIAGTEVAKEQADVIVMDDDFATIVKVVKWGRAVYINIQKFVQFQLTVNIVALMINFGQHH
ncbi:hypothetical protein LXL04_018506 [Taraxacum kok-saghyz]